MALRMGRPLDIIIICCAVVVRFLANGKAMLRDSACACRNNIDTQALWGGVMGRPVPEYHGTSIEKKSVETTAYSSDWKRRALGRMKGMWM